MWIVSFVSLDIYWWVSKGRKEAEFGDGWRFEHGENRAVPRKSHLICCLCLHSCFYWRPYIRFQWNFRYSFDGRTLCLVWFVAKTKILLFWVKVKLESEAQEVQTPHQVLDPLCWLSLTRHKHVLPLFGINYPLGFRLNIDYDLKGYWSMINTTYLISKQFSFS